MDRCAIVDSGRAMPKKSSRQVVQMETAEDAVVESTMCGCEIDPLSGRSQYFQLMFMVGLPLIPVTILVIYSLLKLSSTVKQFTELQVSFTVLRTLRRRFFVL